MGNIQPNPAPSTSSRGPVLRTAPPAPPTQPMVVGLTEEELVIGESEGELVLNVNNEGMNKYSGTIGGQTYGSRKRKVVVVEAEGAEQGEKELQSQAQVAQFQVRKLQRLQAPLSSGERPKAIDIQQRMQFAHDDVLRALLTGTVFDYEAALRGSYELCGQMDALKDLCQGFLGCGSYGCVYRTSIIGTDHMPLVIKVAFQAVPIDDPGSDQFMEIAAGLLLEYYMAEPRRQIPPVFTRTHYIAACTESNLPFTCAPSFEAFMGKSIAQELAAITNNYWKLPLNPVPPISSEILAHKAYHLSEQFNDFLRTIYRAMRPNVGGLTKPDIESNEGRLLMGAIKSAVMDVWDRMGHHAYVLSSKGDLTFPSQLSLKECMTYLLMVASGLIGADHAFAFHHADFHVGNLMLRNIPGPYKYAVIRLDTKYLCIPWVGKVPMIIDFGTAFWTSPSDGQPWSKEVFNKDFEYSVNTWGTRELACPAWDFLTLLWSVETYHRPKDHLEHLDSLRIALQNLLGVSSIYGYTSFGRPLADRKATNQEFEAALIHVLEVSGIFNSDQWEFYQLSLPQVEELRAGGWQDLKGTKYANLTYNSS